MTCRITVAPRSAPCVNIWSESDFLYSVLITPISELQCLHFITKSGLQFLVGVTNCAFVFTDASNSLCPHFGHRMDLLFFSSPLACTSFFLCISHTLLSWLLSGIQG